MSDARSLVTEFYSALYNIAPQNGFLCRGSDLFMHPVLNPNFFLGPALDVHGLALDRMRFSDEFKQIQHWVQVFSGDDDVGALRSDGYLPTLSCAFNIFTRPLKRVKSRDLALDWRQSIPVGLLAQYEEKTAANCHNLPPAIRQQIEQVLRDFSGNLSYGLAVMQSQILGAVTVVRSGGISLFINAWVDQPVRAEGVMRSLFVTALEQEFALGQKAAFYWTLNPLLMDKGDLTTHVRVFERPLATLC